MALPHAELLDIINVAPLGDKLRDAVSTSLIKTRRLQLQHLVLPAQRDVPEHQVEDECVVHCLEGVVEVTMSGGVRTLQAGMVVVLPGGQRHGLRARVDCALLVTLLLRDGDAGDQGGAGNARIAPARRPGP